MPYKSETPTCHVLQDIPMRWSPIAIAMIAQAVIWFTVGMFAGPAVRAWFSVLFYG